MAMIDRFVQGDKVQINGLRVVYTFQRYLGEKDAVVTRGKGKSELYKPVSQMRRVGRG